MANMIVGIGSDIIDVRRVENIIKIYGKKFKNRCFTKNEIQRSEKRINNVNSYAKRYAAKEACAKALGIGLARDVSWKNISVKNNIFGKPSIILTGKALKRLNQLSVKKCSIVVSLSDEKKYAIANVIIFESNEIY